ncbi:hypothetical protein E143388_07880 [Rhodococcus opacus]|nr:hypothetical protein E143388_07880 [Rhodococcus opacus]
MFYWNEQIRWLLSVTEPLWRPLLEAWGNFIN